MKRHNYKPLVSIITPTLNSKRFIGDNIRSVLNQTYTNIEHIIIDGGSTDNTLSIIKSLDPNAVVISEPDKGISDAFNKGLRLASGDIIAVLNSDDYYAHDQVIQQIVEIFSSKDHVKMIYGKIRSIEQETGKAMFILGEPFSLKKMRRRLITHHPAVFAMRKVYETVGNFLLEYKVCMDHEYFLRVTQLYEPYFIDEVLTIMRWGGRSTGSSRNMYLGHRETYRILRSNGVNRISALINLVYRYTITSLSLALQKIGLTNLVLFYRKLKGQL
jgi:glycosyltransferase involved in cell wall biosynthesis